MRLSRIISCLFLGVFLCCSVSFAQQSKIDSLENLLNAHPEKDDQRAELLHTLGFILHTSHPERTIELTDEILSFSDRITNKKYVSGAYTVKAVAHIAMSNLEEARTLSLKALEIDRKFGQREGIASNTSNLGLIEYRLNNYPKALANFQEAARIFSETSHPNEVMMYVNMASIYAGTKNFVKAEEYLEKVLLVARENGNRRMEGYALLNLGTMYTENKDYANGRHYLETALKLSREINDVTNIAKAYGNLGSNYARVNQYDTANYFLLKALEVNHELKNSKSIAVNKCNLGENYIALGNLPQAYAELTESLAIGRQFELLDVQRDASDNLSKYFERAGRYDSALFYQKDFIALRDSIENESNQNQLTRLELQYDFDLKEQEYLQQQAISSLQIRQLWLYGILLLMVIIGVAGFFLNRSRVSSLQLRNKMREQELTRQAESLLLQQQVSESELKAIRSQMNPHFIFNVLSSIESYILENEPRAASKLVQKFARLARLILENSTQSLVVAGREWQAVQLYAELEAERFGHSFDFQFEVDPTLDLSTFMLPPMLIQPLVENAIHHGLRQVRGYRGKLAVRMESAIDQVVITVSDNGIGRENAKSLNAKVEYKEKSTGMTAIRERLDILSVDYAVVKPNLIYEDLSLDGQLGTTAILNLPLIPFQQQEPLEA
ncbi:tetratricopeptide (TPR) repeat protein [Algoriphagus sp. 4150]|uniref:tetratricopeptide repeat-containing sensor histidine kinase n=1 Tax=Algoriphagus sp. 4150 TaxID=2817756 RepID=UPI002864C277|nr:tetratricopeptide repeat protein [Algoriphagus sp. 4150]MDR7131807.1 tetratricopeptide (TPR) repeat protein [Algoriphagus sp. 4150]